jgi:hypothetical protein
LNGGVKGLLPCVATEANVTQYTETVTRGISPLLLVCAGKTDVLVLSTDGAPWIKQCAKTEVRRITAASGEFVFFYLFLVGEGLLLFAWYAYKSVNERDQILVTSNNKIKTSKAASDVELQDLVVKGSVDDLDAGELRMQGYQRSAFGSIAKSSLAVSSVIWILLMLILTLDYYGVFASIAGKTAGFMACFSLLISRFSTTTRLFLHSLSHYGIL